MKPKLGLPTILFLIFVTLKLTGAIGWSWWWVIAPLWISFLIGFIVFILLLFGAVAFDGKLVVKTKKKPFQPWAN